MSPEPSSSYNMLLEALQQAKSRLKRLEVSKNVKYIAVNSRASKLQVFKVQPGQDLNPGQLRESTSLC